MHASREAYLEAMSKASLLMAGLALCVGVALMLHRRRVRAETERTLEYILDEE